MAADKTTPAKRVRKAPQIRVIGAQDWANGTAQIKMMLIGPKDAGKTRYSSSYPRPIFLATEPTVSASITSRQIAYDGGLSAPHLTEIDSTDAMLDVIDYLDRLSKPPMRKPDELPRYQTAVLDTVDGLSRLCKEEWVTDNEAGMFTGRDAWSYLEAKMGLILTRLNNLDMNVLVLCHLRDYEVDVTNPATGKVEKETRYGPQLQGQTKDNIFNDYDLVGRIDTSHYNEGGERIVGRGITFTSDTQYPFLCDHFALSPPGAKNIGASFWPVEIHDGTRGKGTPELFVESNFGLLFGAIMDGLGKLPEGGVVEEVPRAAPPAPSTQGVQAPGQGGPVAGAGKVAPAPGAGATPAPGKKATKKAATKEAAKKAAPAAEKPAEQPQAEAAAPSEPPQEAAAPAAEPTETPETPVVETSGPAAEPAVEAPAEQPAETEPAEAAAAEPAEPTAADAGALETATTVAQQGLGGEVVDDSAVPDTQKEGHCPVCGKPMEGETPDLVQLSRLKHRTLVLSDGRNLYDAGGSCYECYTKLNTMKQNADADAVSAGTYLNYEQI